MLARQATTDINHCGFDHVSCRGCSIIYAFRGSFTPDDLRRLATDLLADPVIQRFEVCDRLNPPPGERTWAQIHFRPGVMDPVAQTALATTQRWAAGSRQLTPGIHVTDVATARRYHLEGVKDRDELNRIATKALANVVIQQVFLNGWGRCDPLPETFATSPSADHSRRVVPFVHLDAAALAEFSRRNHLFLSVDELQAIQRHYAALDRDPTDLELETFAQTWSEHCVHKTLKSEVVYQGPGFGGDSSIIQKRYGNLLKDTIVAATRRINKHWCLSVFEDNAGVIEYDDDFGIAFKVETHNHPSAIEPYGGAATGVGGCIRDIMGCGLGAKPIASTDVFCLGPPDWSAERVPHGVIHPRRVLTGVVSGVRDYGNRMGIPTVNGAIFFDPGYLANPLVFCGCVGLIPRNRIDKRPQIDDHVVLVGGRTGRDGIHGATFSSSELTDHHADEFSHAVQIGNAIEEKKVLDAILSARDHMNGCLFNAITDCGAGGFSSAVGEMAAELGAEIHLEKVPLKYEGLRYDEIWISEAQERMVLAVPQTHIETLLAVFQAERVDATVIGRFTGLGTLRVYYQNENVGELDCGFLHNGLPRSVRHAEWPTERENDRADDSADVQSELSLAQRLPAVLRSLNVASREWVIRQYDHEVQAGGAIKPLVGPGHGPSDAAVVRPRLDRPNGVAIGCGLYPALNDTDPYEMAIRAVDEALRNVICVGGDPERTAILDNFCWGEVESAIALGGLVRACQGAHDAAVAFGLPFISGKDSLNNNFSMSAAEAKRVRLPQNLSIPPTLLISAFSVIADVRKCITMDFKADGNHIFHVRADDETGLDTANSIHRRVAHWIATGQVVSAHDVSDGGLAVAVAEMCIGGGCGAKIRLNKLDLPPPYHAIFANEPSRYVLECPPDVTLTGPHVIEIGIVTEAPLLTFEDAGQVLARWDVDDLARHWRSPIRSYGDSHDGSC